jgi:hypothetical protein
MSGSMLASGLYEATPSSYTDGQQAPVHVNANGALQVVGVAGTSYMGQTASPVQFITVTPTVDTSAYTANDVLFDSTAVAGATRANNTPAILESITWVDKDDNTAANLTFYFFSANVSLGTANSAPSISDANALNFLGHVVLASAEILDVGGAKVGTVRNIGLVVTPATGTTTIYVACQTAGTPTHTAGGVQVRLGFRSS